ncbi:MAG: hypothetical protein AABY22_05450 [Nanoarchaeota archaeon]
MTKEEIKKNPYEYINNFMEESLIHVGRKTFSILSLMPCSLILPNIPFTSSSIRSNINLIYIAPSSSGKSTLCSNFENFSYFPLKRRSISASELSMKANEMKLLTLIIEDFSQTSEDYETIKVIEGIIGEEQNISKSNMRVEFLEKIKGVGFLCGTPTDLDRYAKSLEGGLLSRCMVIYLYHTPKQHSEIGDFINSKIGEEDHSDRMKEKEQIIINYYKELQLIQEGKHEKIKPIQHYLIDKEFKMKAGNVWKKITEKLIEEMGDKYWIRDLGDFYRILVSSAFLNVFNREHENGVLKPNEEDFKLALELMKQNMKYKWAIIKSTELNKKIKNYDVLLDYLNSERISPSVKNILMNISPYSHLIRDKFNQD